MPRALSRFLPYLPTISSVDPCLPDPHLHRRPSPGSFSLAEIRCRARAPPGRLSLWPAAFRRVPEAGHRIVRPALTWPPRDLGRSWGGGRRAGSGEEGTPAQTTGPATTGAAPVPDAVDLPELLLDLPGGCRCSRLPWRILASIWPPR